MSDHPLSQLFSPRSVAVFGASGTPGRVGYYIYRNLLTQGFAGAVLPINPKRRTVLGQPCFASLSDAASQGVPPVDLAVIATPAGTVPGILRDCAAVGTRSVIVISAGFGEGAGAATQSDEAGPALREEVRDLAVELGIRFVGPNCLGLVRPGLNLNATFQNAMPPAGGLALISQSGAICSAIADMAEARGLRFSTLVSLGNSLNVGLGDAIAFHAQDAQTRAILAYVEGVRDAGAFLTAIRQASAVKPVIVLKAGRHGSGAQAATTHTGALAGADDVFRAAVERAGAVQVGTLGDLLAAAEVLSAGMSGFGNRLAIVTNGGGAGVLAADRAGDLGMDLPAPAAPTLAALDAVLPPFWSRRNPLDILGDAGAAQYRAAIQACLADPGYDAVLVLLSPQSMTDATAVAEAVLHERLTASKPLLTCFLGDGSVRSARARLEGAGVADFSLPERAVEALAALSRHQRAHVADRPVADRRKSPDMAPDLAPDMVAAQALVAAQKGGMLNDRISKAILAAAGIRCATLETAATADEAVAIAGRIGGPVALKIDSPDISHKSDVDGVRLKLDGPAAVRAAFDDITAKAARLRPGARILGVTVEPMVAMAQTRELLVGVKTDPVFGPVISFGAGGTMVEILRDSAVALPPLSPERVVDLIGRTRVSRALGAFRNLAPVDAAALTDVMLRVSSLVQACPSIRAMDINPLFAAPEGVIAIDARIELAPQAG